MVLEIGIDPLIPVSTAPLLSSMLTCTVPGTNGAEKVDTPGETGKVYVPAPVTICSWVTVVRRVRKTAA